MSFSSRLNLGLPLLAKELTEQSARRRTYVIRVLYAAALYGFTLWASWNQLGSWNSNAFSVLGKGRDFFEAIAGLQFAGLYLFLPAMTCGVLTSEKERDTLALLLLTKLGPWTIVFEKLLGRLVPMASFLLLSTPLLAISYSLGGVEEVAMVNLAWALAVTAVQVGSLAILCSAWCRTTSAAFLATYLIGAVVILGPPILTQGGQRDLFGLVSAFTLYFQSLGIVESQQPEYGGSEREAVFVLFGPWLALHPASKNLPFPLTVARSVPIMMFSLTCLFAARLVLWRRAFVQPSNYLLKFFKSLDSFFWKANQNRFTKGIVLIHESVTLPLFDPIRWRETKKRSLGTTRYLIRMLLALELPVLFGMLLPDYNRDDGGFGPTVIACVLWVVVALVLTVQSTALIGLERSRQTLDVLLTTSMSSEHIVREKFAGVWRMIRMLWIPFATAYLFRIWWQLGVNSRNLFDGSVMFGAIAAFLAVAIYPPLIAWIGFHQGMKRRSQTQATLVTLGLLAAGCAIPILIAELAVPGGASSGSGPFNRTLGNTSVFYAMRWLSPAFVLTFPSASGREFGEFAHPSHVPYFALLIGHFVFAGGLLAFLWSRGVRTFARHVNRNDGQILDDDDIDRLALLRKQIVGSGVFRAKADQ
ncbi:MAG: ABC transporter permease subunit [Candidatus Saccharimonas sp.]|nr:ABC transporter permease subunit [Planctomycetaceae bacterium]